MPFCLKLVLFQRHVRVCVRVCAQGLFCFPQTEMSRIDTEWWWWRW